MIWWKGVPVFITAKSGSDASLRNHYFREVEALSRRLTDCENRHTECVEKHEVLMRQFHQFQRSVARALPHSIEIEAAIQTLDKIEEEDHERS